MYISELTEIVAPLNTYEHTRVVGGIVYGYRFGIGFGLVGSGFDAEVRLAYIHDADLHPIRCI